MRLLVVSPFAPRLDARHGGARVIAQLVSRLAERHDVGLLCAPAADDPPVDDLLRVRCDLVEEIPRTWQQLWPRRARMVAAVARGRPTWVVDLGARMFAHRIREVAEMWRPDVIQFESHVMAQYRGAVATVPAPTIVTYHEPSSAAAREAALMRRGPARLAPLIEIPAWRRFERRILSEVDAVVAFSERDRRELLRLCPRAAVVRIPLATEIPPQPLDAAGVPPPTVLFVGNFMHPPNVDAALRLVREIFPLVQRAAPTAALSIVGESPPRRLIRLSGGRVNVTGSVPDVTPFLDAAAVVAAPIRLGGGVRVKVLEALAAGKAVVASRRALEGLDVVDGEHVLMAEGDREFAASLARVVLDEELRITLGRRAREWASGNISWQRTVEAYEELYSALLEGRP